MKLGARISVGKAAPYIIDFDKEVPLLITAQRKAEETKEPIKPTETKPTIEESTAEEESVASIITKIIVTLVVAFIGLYVYDRFFKQQHTGVHKYN